VQEILINFFGDLSRIIVFLHIVGTSFLLGSMIMIRFIIRPTLMAIDDEALRYNRCIKILDYYAYYVIATMVLIISASFTMVIGMGFEYDSPTLYSLIHVKEAIWVFIAFNFIYMYIKLINAKELYKKREFFEVNENLSLITKYLIPMNIILTLIAIYMGIILRGF